MKGKHLLRLTLILFLAACTQPQAPATDERAERLTQYFEDADLNDDGVLGRSEIDSEIDGDFDALDYNGDGVVTTEDIRNEKQGLPDGVELDPDISHHLPYDLDGDGGITRDEYRRYIETEMLEAMDANGDGAIGLEEYLAYNGL